MCPVTHSTNTHSLSKCGTESSARAISIRSMHVGFIYCGAKKFREQSKHECLVLSPPIITSSCTCLHETCFLSCFATHTHCRQIRPRVTASRISLSCKWASLKLGLAGTNSDNFKFKNVFFFPVRLSGIALILLA
jgi:hypothetical protein